jgi:hypothetical protein
MEHTKSTQIGGDEDSCGKSLNHSLMVPPSDTIKLISDSNPYMVKSKTKSRRDKAHNYLTNSHDGATV